MKTETLGLGLGLVVSFLHVHFIINNVSKGD